MQNLPVCTRLFLTCHGPVLQQAQGSLQGQVQEARQKDVAQQEELNNATKKLTVAEQQQQELQDRLKAVQQSLEQSHANCLKADQVCLLITGCLLGCFLEQNLSHAMPILSCSVAGRAAPQALHACLQSRDCRSRRHPR